VRLSARSKYVNISDEVEEALGTQRHLAKILTPLVLAHGTDETPKFQRRTRDFAAALKAANKPVKHSSTRIIIISKRWKPSPVLMPFSAERCWNKCNCVAPDQREMNASDFAH
jgi:hypothetical protein